MILVLSLSPCWVLALWSGTHVQLSFFFFNLYSLGFQKLFPFSSCSLHTCVCVCVCGSCAHMCMSVWRPEDNLGCYLSGVIHLLERVSHWSGICQVVLAGLLANLRDQPGSTSPAPGSQECDTMLTIFLMWVLGIDFRTLCLQGH